MLDQKTSVAEVGAGATQGEMAAAVAAACCSAEEQASCCAPAAKASCCGPAPAEALATGQRAAGGCGCR